VRTTKARRVTVLVAVGGLAALAGCSGQQPGAAAIVDGRTISSSEVRDVLTELTPYFQGATTPNVLSVLIQEPVVVQVAADEGVGVSDEDAQALLDQSVEASGGKAGQHFSDASLDVARYSVAYQNLQTKGDAALAEVQKRLEAQKVTVNPRFGHLDESDVQVSDPVPWPWLHTGSSDATAAPTPEPTPSPTPTQTP